MQAELERRASATQQVLALFFAQPNRWIHWRRFERFSACAWRTRISECRRLVQAQGGDVIWNKRVYRSAYLYRPYVQLGRDASAPVSQQSLF